MKVILTLDEAKAILRGAVAKKVDPSVEVSPDATVRFVHRYSDGSGETDIETLGEVDRVEVEVR